MPLNSKFSSAFVSVWWTVVSARCYIWSHWCHWQHGLCRSMSSFWFTYGPGHCIASSCSCSHVPELFPWKGGIVQSGRLCYFGQIHFLNDSPQTVQWVLQPNECCRLSNPASPHLWMLIFFCLSNGTLLTQMPRMRFLPWPFTLHIDVVPCKPKYKNTCILAGCWFICFAS